MTVLLYFAAVLASATRKPWALQAADLSGRCWVRTSDLFGVNEALSR